MSCGRTPAMRERARRGVAEADVERVGAVGDVVGGIRVALGARRGSPRAGARGRGPARPSVTTTAAAQSVSRQQSNRRNGSLTHGDAR